MLYSEFDDLQAEAEMICGTEDSQERERDQFEDQYFESVALARSILADSRVKALHLELVTDLTRESFLAALARFMSRRGKPTTIHSDNGTSFVGASKEIKRMLDNCAEDISEQGIEFKFIPPYTPHFGG
ncbi:uncharacterized protein ACR2FA_001321 [Aphomia sociella]